MPVIDEAISTVPTHATQAADGFRGYLACIATVLLVVYLAGFLLVRIPSYERWGGSSFGPILDYAFQTAGQNADVLVFGDSSAFFAIDPIQMSQELGLKVVNLPNTIGGLPVIGDMALKHYLQTNRPPRMILFYFCAWNLDYAKAQGTRIFEGEEMLVRHGSGRQILRFALRHPREVFYFPFRVYSELGPGALLHLQQSPSGAPEVAAHRGHVANLLPSGPLAGDCTLPDQLLAQHQDASVRTLLSLYSSSGTHTMLYLAPVPACKGVDKLLTTASKIAGAGPPSPLPPQNFSADGYYAHLKPEAVEKATSLAAAQMRRQLEKEVGGRSQIP